VKDASSRKYLEQVQEFINPRFTPFKGKEGASRNSSEYTLKKVS